MTDSTDYRKFLEAEFDFIKVELAEIKAHLIRQNGSIHDLEVESIKRQVAVDDFRTMEKEIPCELKSIKTELQLVEKDIMGRWIKKNWKWALIIFMVAQYLFYSLFENYSIKDIISMIKG